LSAAHHSGAHLVSAASTWHHVVLGARSPQPRYSARCTSESGHGGTSRGARTACGDAFRMSPASWVAQEAPSARPPLAHPFAADPHHAAGQGAAAGDVSAALGSHRAMGAGSAALVRVGAGPGGVRRRGESAGGAASGRAAPRRVTPVPHAPVAPPARAHAHVHDQDHAHAHAHAQPIVEKLVLAQRLWLATRWP